MTSGYDYTYADCVERSLRANWDIEDFDDLNLDFSRPFLPEELAQTASLAMLDPAERLRLNHIRGYSYAYLFRYIEEYIVRLVGDLADEHQDPTAKQALGQFQADEIKHQELFSLFENQFLERFGSPCDVIGDLEATSAAVLNHSRAAVLLLTSMLEWLTQAHYLAYFNEPTGAAELDEAYRQLFRLHWVEEAQHARIDSLETLRAVAPLTEHQRELAVDEFLDLCAALVLGERGDGPQRLEAVDPGVLC
ncbi:MAG: metal-dependent hydrolase, partial [Actinomycetota bacterium]